MKALAAITFTAMIWGVVIWLSPLVQPGQKPFQERFRAGSPSSEPVGRPYSDYFRVPATSVTPENRIIP